MKGRANPVEPAELRALLDSRTVEHPSGCLVWTGALNSSGYGKVKIANQCVLVHRLALYLALGAWPEPWLVVMHTCDNPPCVRVGHLSLGSHADNMRDAQRKGRLDKQMCKKGLHVIADDFVLRGGVRRCGPCSRLRQAEYAVLRRGKRIAAKERQAAA